MVLWLNVWTTLNSLFETLDVFRLSEFQSSISLIFFLLILALLLTTFCHLISVPHPHRDILSYIYIIYNIYNYIISWFFPQFLLYYKYNIIFIYIYIYIYFFFNQMLHLKNWMMCLLLGLCLPSWTVPWILTTHFLVLYWLSYPLKETLNFFFFQFASFFNFFLT